MGESEQDTILAIKSDWSVSRTSIVDEIFALSANPLVIAVATLKDEDLLGSDMPVRRITTAGLHPNEHGRITSLLISTQNIYEDPRTSCRSPVDLAGIEHRLFRTAPIQLRFFPMD